MDSADQNSEATSCSEAAPALETFSSFLPCKRSRRVLTSAIREIGDSFLVEHWRVVQITANVHLAASPAEGSNHIREVANEIRRPG